MRFKLIRVAVACAAFVVGLSVGTVHRYVPQQQQAEVPAPSPAPTPVHEETTPPYPETLDLTPWDIENFVNEHPYADLDRLWQRLGVTDDPDALAQFNFSGPCGNCEAIIFQYNLDDDADREVVLQIRQQFAEMYRYLIFKDSRELNSKLIGKIDVWTKYPPADPVVLVSNNRSWLVVQSTAATGSGLGAWRDTVYEVSDSGVRKVASYLGEVRQMGSLGYPSRTFVGRPVSCEIKNGRAILKVSYTVEFFGSDTHLFTKTKTVVLGSSIKDGSTFVLAGQSEISPYEFETIYNFDSMGEDDFVTYNRDELRAIATGNDRKKKAWLKEFLETYPQMRLK